MKKNVKKINEELATFKVELQKYKALFLKYGIINSEEQKKLEAMELLIHRIESKLSENAQSSNDSNSGDLRKQMNKELNDLKAEMEMMLNIYNLS